MVEKDTVHHSPKPSNTSTGNLSPAAPVFKPTSPGIGPSKEGDNSSINCNDKDEGYATVNESSTQWVNRAFGANNTTTNEGNATDINT